MTTADDLYRYRARLVPWSGRDDGSAWHDGDTCAVDVDLGCRAHWRGHLRTAGYNAPELHSPTTEAGQAAADYVRSLVDSGGYVFVDSVAFQRGDETDDFGRMLGAVTLEDGRDLAELMIASGHGVPDP